MCRGKPSKHIPDDIYKLIVDLSATLSNRQIAKVITDEHDYTISYSTINKLLKELREERAEVLKDKFTQDISETLPKDLEIIDDIIDDLYGDYEILKGSTDRNIMLLKLKIAKSIGTTIEIKFRNCGTQESKQMVNWEDYLNANEGDTYSF